MLPWRHSSRACISHAHCAAALLPPALAPARPPAHPPYPPAHARAAAKSRTKERKNASQQYARLDTLHTIEMADGVDVG